MPTKREFSGTPPVSARPPRGRRARASLRLLLALPLDLAQDLAVAEDALPLQDGDEDRELGGVCYGSLPQRDQGDWLSRLHQDPP